MIDPSVPPDRAEPEASLAERAYRRLEEAIVTLELPPGAVLTENRLIDLVGVGRTPVREALIRRAWYHFALHDDLEEPPPVVSPWRRRWSRDRRRPPGRRATR